MTSLLLTFIPDQALILVIVAVGIGLMIGLVSRSAAFGIISFIVLYLLISPFIGALLDILPLWLLFLLMVFFVLSIGRTVLSSLFGRRATGHFVGHLMWFVFTLPFRIFGFVFGMRRK
jgi:hypothetical protein